MAIKIPVIVATIIMKWHSIKELVKGAYNGSQHQNGIHHKTSPIDCDRVIKCSCSKSHGTNIHIMWQRILNYTIEIYNSNWAEKNETIVSSDTLSWSHQFLVCIYICLLGRYYVNYLEYSYNTWYVYNNNLSAQTRTKVIRREHIILPTGFGVYSSTCF